MKKFSLLAAALLAAIMLMSSPASAADAWTYHIHRLHHHHYIATTQVALTAAVNSDAFNDQDLTCYYYNGGNLIYSGNSAFYAQDFQTYLRARCNPSDATAKSLSLLNSTNLLAYDQGERTGYCFRWLGAAAVGTLVSQSCVDTVERVYYGNFYTTRT